MKIAPAAAVVVLIVLLTWLSLHSLDPQAEAFDRALAETDRFTGLQAALHRDVLSARVGLLSNYDPLVREVDGLDASAARLRQIANDDPALAKEVDRLADALDREETLVESFKSNNALLRNSLAYFTLFSLRLGTDGEAGPLAPAAGALATAMLHLTLNTAPSVANDVARRLDDFAHVATPGGPEIAQALLAHARLLQEVLPRTDGLLRDLYASRLQGDQAAVRRTILDMQSAARESARYFRAWLYVASLVLVALLVHLGMRLRARARALRRRAAFEHVIANVSMRFANADSVSLAADIEGALAQMATCLGADRAHYQFRGPIVRTYAWHAPGAPAPPGWPDQAWRLMQMRGPVPDETVRVRHVRRLPPGEERTVLAGAGVQGWACIARTSAEGVTHLLSFEATAQPPRLASDGELGLFRMALDAVAGAQARQTLQQEQARLETRLQQARRLATVGALASGVAHNFNNIIGAILGYTEMTDEPAATPKQWAGIRDGIHLAAERAREIVEQMLAFGQRRSLRQEPVRIQALLAEALSLLRASLPDRIALDLVRTSEQEALVSGQPAQLLQVILNLCHNAADAIAGEGRIAIGMQLAQLASGRTLSHGVLAPGGYICLSVTDTGAGIDAAVLGRIFEPFYTTRATGTGLGLATSQETVHEHGGAMHVSSTPGLGSRFEAWLPATAATVPPQHADAAPHAQGETVLVLDRDPASLLRAEEILAALGYEPVGFTRAVDAQDACRVSPARFDAAVVGDASSASETLEVTRALSTLAHHLPIVLTTACADDFDAPHLLGSGVSDVVPRPIGATDVAAALERCLRHA